MLIVYCHVLSNNGCPDFPRIFRIVLNRAGVPDKIVMTISGHKTRSVFDRYNIVDERDLHDATSKLEQYLAGATGPVWAQLHHLQPQPKNPQDGKANEGKPVTH